MNLSLISLLLFGQSSPFYLPQFERSSNEPTMVAVSASELPTIPSDGDIASFRRAIQRQLIECAKGDLTQKWNFAGRSVTRKEWCIDTGNAFLELTTRSGSWSELLSLARDRMDWFKTTGRDGQGNSMFTGYYFPTLEGSLTRSSAHQYPLYKKPSDLEQVSIDGKIVWRRRLPGGGYGMHFDRREIDMDGALKSKGLEIGYVKDVFGAFILHVQGSGQIKYKDTDGSDKFLITNYAASNGHAYVSLRKVLMDRGIDPKYWTLQGMKLYFKENPEQMMPMLATNPSYIYFQAAADGPYGSSNVILEPWHSVAMDHQLFPMGAVTFFDTDRPVKVEGAEQPVWQKFSRFALVQDTGGAIKGPGRMDVYWGGDEYAEYAAGQMSQPGGIYFAVLKKSARR